jgi:hypothetical protein
MTSEVKFYLKDGLTFAAYFDGMFFVAIPGNRGLSNGITDRADDGCRIIGTDKDFNAVHMVFT